jgi:carbon monoxide dehydrogenase subunit G
MKIIRRAAVLLSLALGAPSASGARVEITRAPDKSYEVEGSFKVKAPAAAVWAVLTDYDRIGGFVKAMRSSRVVASRVDGTTVVEQEAVGGVLIFSRTVKVVLEIRREPGRLAFVDVGREDFWDYSGSWSVTERGDESEVVYRLSATPDFTVPPFLMRSGMKKGAGELLDQVREEIVRRGA